MSQLVPPPSIGTRWATPAGQEPVQAAVSPQAIRVALMVLGDTTNAASVNCLQVIALCRAVAAMHGALIQTKANDRTLPYRVGEARRDGQQPIGTGERWPTPREIVERLFAGGDL